MSVLLVDDHAMIAEPLKLALEASGFARVHAADATRLDLDSVIGAARDREADIVLLDLHLGGQQPAVPMVGPLVELGARVVLFTASQDPRLLASGLRAGAEAVIDKAMAFNRLVAVLAEMADGRELMPTEEREALIEALEGRYRKTDDRRGRFEALTEREGQVLRALVDGHAPKQIARRDGISVSTVRGHIERIFAKLGVSSQREALALARAVGWPGDQGGAG